MNNKPIGEILRFLLVGGLTVMIDLIIYLILIQWLNHSISKSLSFISGTIFAYQANRIWTFSAGTNNLLQVLKFSIVYGFNLGVNVSINSWILSLLGKNNKIDVIFAFIVATGVSATLNFLGMKFLVFNIKKT